MKAVSIIAAGLAGWLASAAAAETPGGEAVRAIKKSLRYVADGGRDWMEGRNCASCHHAPMTIWSLEHAKQRGFEIDAATLKEVTAWTLDPKVMPKPVVGAPKKKEEGKEKAQGHAQEKVPGAGATKKLETPAKDAAALKKEEEAQAAREAEEAIAAGKAQLIFAYYALGTDRAEVSPVSADMRAKINEHFLEKQEADGAWHSYIEHPPMLDDGEMTTLTALVTLLGKNGKSEPTTADWAERKARALEYLAKAKPREELQPKLWRVLLRKYLGTSEDAAKLGGSQQADVKAVLEQQNADGGWGQAPELASDAYATGQVLYFLMEAGCEMSATVKEKAVAFLVKTQQADGSWVITPRNRVLPKPGPGAKKVEIIGYAGTAWGAMGLVSAVGTGGAVE